MSFGENLQYLRRHEESNPSPEKKKRDALTGKLCGCIMLAATIIYLILGWAQGSWESAWIVYGVAGILCGVAAIVLGKDDN